MKKFNINDYMYIQINDDGWKHLRNTVGKDYIDACIKTPAYEKIIGDEVWYRLQCHNVFDLFPIQVGFGQLFNTNVMFDDDLIEKDITRLQEKYDENGYDCSMIIKLQRIEDRVDSTLLTYSNELKDLKKSILDLKENLETTCQSMDLISDSDILQPYGSVIGSLTKILKL